MHFIFPTAASSLSLLTMQRVCYNWLEQIYWIGIRRYHRSRVCVCVWFFNFFNFYFFQKMNVAKPLMHLIYVNRTRVNMLRLNIFLYIVAFWQHLVVILLTWLILCRHQCSCYASVNSSCAQPPSPPPQATARHLPALSVPGEWGICKFCTARGPGICQPRGH